MSLLRNIDKYVQYDERRKIYVPQYWRKEVLPSWLGFVENEVPNTGVFAINAAGTRTPPVVFKQPYSSVEGLDRNLGTPFEIRSLVFADSTDTTAAADFTLLLREEGERRNFMNNPCHIRTIVGTAQQPALLREPYFLLSQHQLSATFNKIAGGATTVRMFLVGAQYFPWSPEFMRKQNSHHQIVALISKWMERRKYVSPFWLTTEQTIELAGNATGEFFLLVGDDGHFEGFTLASVQTGNFAWELSEPKTQQTIMNGLATQTNGLGDAQFPTLLPTPYLVPSGYRLRLRITDLSGNPNTIFFTMGGRKLFVPFKDVGDVQATYSVPTPADVPSQIVPAPLV